MSLLDYNSVHAGERLFILGNGPSLESTPLKLLEDEYTLAMNKIDTIFERTEWRPTYYLNVIGGELTVERISRFERMIDTDIPCFLREFGQQDEAERVSKSDLVEFLKVTELQAREIHVDRAIGRGDIDAVWSTDITEGVYRQHTSIYSAVQIADFMGFDSIYFVGCDLYPVFKPFPYMIFKSGSDPCEYQRVDGKEGNPIDFMFSEKRPLRSAVNGLSYKLLRDNTVINPLYRLYQKLGLTEQTHAGGNHHPNTIYKVGENIKERRAHRAIKEAGKRRGFATYNATVGGELEVYERLDIEEVVSGQNGTTSGHADH